MSPLSRQSTIFLQSKLTEEPNSDSFWIDSIVSSSLHGETFSWSEGVTTTLDCPPAFPTDHLLPSFEDDHLGPPPATSDVVEHVSLLDFTANGYNVPFNIQPEDLLDPTYQSTFSALFHDAYNACVPAEATTVCETPETAPAPRDVSVTAITQTLSTTRLVPGLVDPSTMSAYDPYFHHVPLAPVCPDNGTVASPLSPSASSSSCDSLESESDAEYVPPSDDDDYHPAQSTSHQKQKKRKTTKSGSPRRVVFSPARSTSSESEKSVASSRASRRSHPYRRDIPSRNFQCEDTASIIAGGAGFRCPVAGCDYAQENQRIPDLKRHIITHNRWLEPEKWICCGVGMERAHLYGTGIKQGMTDEECIKAGAYDFRGRLMIGGCMKTFARRDALKRHVDNRNISCVGHMDSYYF